MNSLFLRLNLKDLAKGAAIAALAVIFGAFQEAINVHGLDFALYDWSGILDLAMKAAGLYLSKNLLSDQDGKVLGKIG